MRIRKNILNSLMNEALEVSTRSKDEQTKVGAILIDKEDYDTVTTGYNGFCRDVKDELLPKTRPDKYPYMIHAEENIITHCAKKGKSTTNSFLICTLSPCVKCLRLCWQSGIDTIIFLDKYRDFEQCTNMLDLNVDLEYIFTKDHKLVKMTLSPR